MSTGAPDPNQPLPPPAPDPNQAPQWATELMAKIDSLPGKLQAVVTDQDIDKIFTGLHGKFEKSGAFDPPHDPPPPDPAADPTDGDPHKPPTVAPPGGDKPPQHGDSIARKLFGRW